CRRGALGTRNAPRRSMRKRKQHPADLDPSDPAQRLDESGDFHLEPLAIGAQPHAEAEDELDQAQADANATESDEEEAAPPEDEAELATPGKRATKDVGELYGVHTPRAVDRDG